MIGDILSKKNKIEMEGQRLRFKLSISDYKLNHLLTDGFWHVT
jgi:hypothetical protein